jgi:hypothetical protein
VPGFPGLAATPPQEPGQAAGRRSPSEAVRGVAGAPARPGARAPVDSRRSGAVSADWPEKEREAPFAAPRPPAERRARQASRVLARGLVPSAPPVASVRGRGRRQASRVRGWGPESVARRAALVVSAPALAGALGLASMEALHPLAVRPADRPATLPLAVALAWEGARPVALAVTRDGAPRASAVERTRWLAGRRRAAPAGSAGFLASASGLLPPRLPRGRRRRPPLRVQYADRTWPGRA